MTHTATGGRARVAPAPRGVPARRVLAVTVVALLVPAAAGCAPGPASGDPGAVQRAAEVATQAPVVPAPAASITPPAVPGTVQVVAGPFTDRIALDALVLADGVVTGTISVTKDVSELIALEVQVDAYDGAGALVGSEVLVVDPEDAEAYHSTAGVVGYPLAVPATDAVTAVLSVPVLVNE